MTQGSFSRPGAIDLSALKDRAQNAAPASGAGGSGPGGYVRDVKDVQEFEGLLRSSMQHPVVVEFHSPRAQGAQQLSDDLRALANEAAGKYLLARVDADQNPEIAQAIGVQGVPTVVAVIGGQLAPLFQGVQPRQNVAKVLDQVLQAAVANGIVGKAEPVSGGAAPTQDGAEQPKPADPRFETAYAAMEAGDFARAADEFETLLKDTPNDSEALAGRAQAGLLARAGGLDGSEVVRADAAPGDVDAQLAAADAQLLAGEAEAAFARLVECVRGSAGDDRERVRLRLLELFETVGGTDPTVLKYRRKLATALF